MSEKISIVGLGYVGLPVAVAIAAKFESTVGFDTSLRRVSALQSGNDATGEIDRQTLKQCNLKVTSAASDMAGSSFFVITVPTPIDEQNRPDLTPLKMACEFVGPNLRHGAIVVFESTVYPGVTEDYCGPLLEQYSGLKRGVDFWLGYSPERINPGDKEHRLETIMKVVSGEDAESLKRIRNVYGAIIKAGLFEASSIRVAEAAKVLENTQRDLNIALMNEIALIFDRMGIATRDVLAAAGTKWNFLKFSPGLVGGHCIGVDPYYLTAAAEALGYRPEVILAGRRVNDNMGAFVAQKTVKLMMQQGMHPKNAKIAVLGLTFKENVPDIRNSKVFDIITELAAYGLSAQLCDPHADAGSVDHEYGLATAQLDEVDQLDVLILAVPHAIYLRDLPGLTGKVKVGGIIIDVKGAIPDAARKVGMTYWSM